MVAKKKVDKVEPVAEKTEKKDYVEVPVGKYFDKVRANPWIAATFALALVLILVLIFGTGGNAKKISSDEAAKKVVDFLNSNPMIDGEVALVSAKEEGQFHQITLSYQEQQIPVYTTLDGEFLVGNPVSLTKVAGQQERGTQDNNQPAADTGVPKTDKPYVELFVMSHCPFGTQIEKGILPVVTLLGNKIDFEIKFVNYAMHGEKEVLEQLNQYCIQMEQNDKYLNYLRCFLEDGDGEACLTKEKIDKTKLAACTQKADKEFAIKDNLADKSKWMSGRFPQFNTHKAENEKYGVRGSPTLVINGKQVNSGRDPASLLKVVCASFNSPPAECQNSLSSATPSPGFGWSATAADSAAAAQCG